MAICLWGWMAWSEGQPAWLVAGGGIVIGVVVFGVSITLLGVHEVKVVLGALKRRFAG